MSPAQMDKILIEAAIGAPYRPLSPYEQLLVEWRGRPRQHGHTLEEQELAYKRTGFVFSTPSFYAIGRGVCRSASQDELKNPYFIFPPQSYDAWYVAEMCGDMRAVWSIMPWRLPYVGWCLAKDPLQEVRFYPIEQIERLTGRASP